jgi:hypothetical protein
VVLIKPMSWDRHGLKRWIEAAKGEGSSASCIRVDSMFSWHAVGPRERSNDGRKCPA